MCNTAEKIAKACGFETYEGPAGFFRMETDEDSEHFDNGVLFDPLRVKRDAFLSLEAWCKEHLVLATLCYAPMFPLTWMCYIGEEPEEIPVYKDFCTAICTAIEAAEEHYRGGR